MKKNVKRVYSVNKIFYRDYCMFTYMIVVSIFSIILFLYGFFPVNYNDNDIASRKDIPKFIDRSRIKLDEVYKPVVKKVVIMVIDALRWDFVSGKDTSYTMPITDSLLKNAGGCKYKTKVNPPTVTMPRIKAMTTGSVPNFIDVVLNLGAHQISGDSVLLQARNFGHKIIFYGDDTWLKLFPDIFYRYEGTTSFYVTDFTEVDLNVTRNVAMELNKKDWSVMILHYLGLDHIGHIAGPFSHLIKPKLKEMDDIIGTIASFVSEWNKNNEPTLFLVCGDHGMKDSGGHGGATLEETLVPLLVFGKSCNSERKNSNREIAQIDIAPTLSILMGTPIPAMNLGSVILDMISDLSPSQKLFALYYNAEHLFLRYKKISGHEHTQAYKNYINAVKLHAAWLDTHSDAGNVAHDILLMYESAMQEMKHTLTSSLLEYDVSAMTLATIFMGHILYICKSVETSVTTSYKQFLPIFVASYIIWLLLNQIFVAESITILFSQRLDVHFILVTIPLYGVLLVNCYFCATRCPSINKLQKESFTYLQIFLPIATVAHALSFCSSSFVEEEHQTWYFYWITLIIYFSYDVLRKHDKQKSLKLLISLLVLMVSHRILRKLSSTGDKYAHLPDISGWLQDQQSNFGMTIILLLGLVLLMWLDYYYEEREYKSIILLLDGILATLVYLRHAVTDAVFKPSFYFNSRGIIEMHYFWAFTLIYLIHSIYKLTTTMRHNKQKVLPVLLFIILKKWVIVSCVLHRPYNIILLPIQLMAGAIISELTKIPEHSSIKIYLYLWSGNVFYFYQGNSNSLATIDVAAGYVGLESYQPLITVIFLSINTYSAPILALLMYLYDHALQYPLSPSNAIISLCKEYIFWRLIPMTLYTMITNFQRYHLFVWTVFSPKLLYEAVHCTVLFSVMFVLQLHLIAYDWIKTRKKYF